MTASVRITSTRATLAGLVLVLCSGWLTPARAGAADYRLGPEDKLRIRVYDWRTTTGEAHEWPALTGEFTVAASGRIDLPLIGELAAAGRSTADVARDLGVQLQKKVGLAQQPDASIEVVEYRPFFIVGAVQKAGAYPFRPDLTVLQAVGVAGGLARDQDTGQLGNDREAVADLGQLRMLTAERLALVARQARFDAEIAGAAAVSFPDDLVARKSSPSFARMMREEEMLFNDDKSSLAMKIDNINKTREILQSEIAALTAKDVSMNHQLDLVKQELDTVSSLVTKGLTVLPRQLAIEQNISQFESSRLDLQLAQLRAKQDLAKLDRDVIDLKDIRRATALTDSRDTQAKLLTLDEQIKTARSLSDEADTRAAGMTSEADDARPAPPVFTVTRTIDGMAKTEEVQETDPVVPGDTIRVDRHRDALMLSQQP